MKDRFDDPSHHEWTLYNGGKFRSDNLVMMLLIDDDDDNNGNNDEGRKEKFYLTTHSTHFIYGYMAWNPASATRDTLSFLTARVLLYAPSHIQDSTYHGLCYTSHGALAGTRNISMGPTHPPPMKDRSEDPSHH